MDGHIGAKDLCQLRIWTNGEAVVMSSEGQGLQGGKTDKLDNSKSLCRGDEDSADALEAIGKCSRVIAHRQHAAHTMRAGLVAH